MTSGYSRLSIGGDKPSTIWALTFSEHTVVPEIALAKVRKDAPFDKRYIGWWRDDGGRRCHLHSKART